VLTRVTDKSEINFEQAYVEVRDLLETHPWSDFKLRLSDNYLGPDVKDLHHRSEPVWPPLKEEEIRVDPRSPPPLYSKKVHIRFETPIEVEPEEYVEVPITVDERVIHFSSCNSPWETTKSIVKMLDRGRSRTIHDAGMFALLPAAKTIEMHWRRIFLHPDDFHSRHFSIPRAMRAIKSKYIKMNTKESACYESGIDPHPKVCPNGPVWDHFKSSIEDQSGIESLQMMFDLTKKIWYPMHEHRHSKVSEWSEIKPVYKQLSSDMDELFSLLEKLLGPSWV